MSENTKRGIMTNLGFSLLASSLSQSAAVLTNHRPLLPEPAIATIPPHSSDSCVYRPNYNPAYRARIAKNRTRNRISRKSRQRNR